MVPGDLKDKVCRAFGPRKFAWILEMVAEAGEAGDYRRLVYDLEIVRIAEANRLHEQRTRLVLLLVRRLVRHPHAAPPSSPPPKKYTVAKVVREFGLNENSFDRAVGILRDIGAPVRTFMSEVSDEDALRLVDILLSGRE